MACTVLGDSLSILTHTEAVVQRDGGGIEDNSRQGAEEKGMRISQEFRYNRAR
ncbi:MAG: hypothetical protein ACHQJX_08465 [Candidatus Acidiferrales bacterium]|nr:hypothetical protein [Candidatus Acidoferrales bacterium]